MNLVNNTGELQEHINVAFNFDFDKALPFIKRAERKYIIPNISRAAYDELLTVETDDDDIKEVKFLLAEAASNLAFHLGFSQLNVHITNYGTKESELQEAHSVDWATKRDLQRGFTQAGFEALDEALKQMEIFIDKFPEWRNSEAFTIFNEHFNKRTDEFQTHFNIHNSRKTFVSLKPIMREVEEQYFLPMLGIRLMDTIKRRSSDFFLERALELCQKAEVALTISKSVDSGAFIMTGSSAMFIWEQLPWEKTESYSDSRLEKLRETKQKAGEEYLKNLRNLMLENPETFPLYQESAFKSKTILKLKSGLSV